MPAFRASTLLKEFLDRTTRHNELKSTSLIVDRRHGHIAARFAEILGVPPKDFMHEKLTPDQSNTCLKEIIRLESTSPADARVISLDQYFKITQWIIDRKPVNTRSTLTMHYGAIPCLTTRLWFESVGQFHYIRDVMIDLGLCTLNEQHLKLMKPPPDASRPA
jgi:hypothetical protein